MPIVVQHQPSALGIGAVAFQAGLGQYRARQEEMDLKRQQQAMQWAQMALQNQASLRNDYLQQQQMQDANQRFALDRGMQAQEFATRNSENMRQFDVNQKAQDQWRTDQQQMETNRLENQRKLQEAGFEFRTNEAADEAARQEAIREGEPDRKARELEAVEAARLNAAGVRTKKDLEQRLEQVDVAERAPNSTMTPELAEAMRTSIRNKFAGIDMNRLLIENGSPEQKAAALQAEFEANTVQLPDGNRMWIDPKTGEPKPIGPKSDSLMAQEGKNMAAANKAYDEFMDKWDANAQMLGKMRGPDGQPFVFDVKPESRESWTKKYVEQTFPLQHQATQQRLRQMGAPAGEGEPPLAAPQGAAAPQTEAARPPQAPVQEITAKAQQFAAQAPQEVQQAVAFLTQVAQQYPPGTELKMPLEVRRKVEQAKQIIQSHKSQPAQPAMPGRAGFLADDWSPQGEVM
jgi:hypothetical protein